MGTLDIGLALLSSVGPSIKYRPELYERRRASMSNSDPSVAAIGTLVADLYDFPQELISDELRKLAPPDTLFRADPCEMPYLPPQFQQDVIDHGLARAGGQSNLTPQIALAGLKAYGMGTLGSSGLGNADPIGQFLGEDMMKWGITPNVGVHSYYQTGTTLIVPGPADRRPGIVYCPYANLETNLEKVFADLSQVKPTVLHWMYLSLMGESDKKLPQFFSACRNQFSPLIGLDVHTLKPSRSILSKGSINALKLLPFVLPHVDVFFCSDDEAGLVARLLKLPNCPREIPKDDAEAKRDFTKVFLSDLYEKCAAPKPWAPVFGVTDRHGATFLAGERVTRVVSNYDVDFSNWPVNRVGTGDAFRSGVLMYYAKHANEFKECSVDHFNAVQFGNLVATLSMSGSPENRWENIASFDQMLRVVDSGDRFDRLDPRKLIAAVKGA